MKQLHANLKQGEFKLQMENADDLWYLSTLIEPGDTLKGKTLRKITSSDKEQRAKEASKKSVFLAITVEKIGFSTTSTALRVSGVVTVGPEDVPLGSYHTFTVDENTTLTLIKEKWLTYQLNKLKEAVEAKPSQVLICVLDREEAVFALLKKYGYDVLSRVQGSVQKKGDDTVVKGDFYSSLFKQLQEYDTRHNLTTIVIASPAFWKDDLFKKINDDNLKKKIIKATCSSVGDNGINEVLKRPEVKEALRQERSAKELKQVEELFAEISKEGRAVYGIKETKNAAEAGAIKILLLTDHFLQQSRETNSYPQLEKIMRNVDGAKGDITIVSTENEGGKKLEGLGGIGAVLRFKLNYS